MRTALCFQEGNFVGREYFARLVEAGRRPDCVATVGRMKVDSIAREVERTGGFWSPPAIPHGAIDRHFRSASDPALGEWLRAEGIDVAVQGGIGILRGEVLHSPRLGWLNIHPGALPGYRGNACPEWAVLNGDPVVATAHLIDDGVDTGPIICATPYEHSPDACYATFRAGIYVHCARVLIEALALLSDWGTTPATPQSASGACYREPMDSETLSKVRSMFPLKARDEREPL